MITSHMKYSLNRADLFYLTVILFFIVSQGEAQSVKRQTIGSACSSNTIDGVSVEQTIGQPYFTGAYYDNNLGLRPGFQQLSKIQVESIHSTLKLHLNVYPNPASYSVTIQSSDTIKSGLVQVMDINGKIILEEKVNQVDTYSINCESWQSGSYYMSLYDEQNNKYTAKLIITK